MGNDPKTRIKASLRLLRLHLLPTAWADVAAGAFLAGQAEARSIVPALFLSSSVYLFGMVTNGLFDIPRDKRLHPDRPLPSGEVTPAAARGIAAALLLSALCAALWVSMYSKGAAAVIVVLASAYNLGVKRIPVAGPVILGMCRGLNLLVGAWAGRSEFTLPPGLYLPAVALASYAALITQLSALEGKHISKGKIRAFAGSFLVFPVVFLAFAPAVSFVPLAALTLATLSLAALTLAALTVLAVYSIPKEGFIRDKPNQKPVALLLCGIYLVDGFFLGYAGRPLLCIVLTVAGLGSVILVKRN